MLISNLRLKIAYENKATSKKVFYWDLSGAFYGIGFSNRIWTDQIKG